MIFLLSLLPYVPIANLEQAIMDLLGQALPQEAASLFTGVVRDLTSSSSGGLLSFGTRSRPVVRLKRDVRPHAATEHHV